MKRREFITLVGGSAVGWPLTAYAQQPAMPVIGFMSSRSPTDFSHLLQSFRRGLGETGYVESRNVTIEYRWAEGRYERLPAVAAELVSRQVAVIASFGGSAAARAAKAATATIPIVISIGEDPAEARFVQNLNRPEGNITGVMLFTSVLGSKRLGLLRELAPNAGAIGVLVNLTTTSGQTQTRDVEQAARELGQRLVVLDARTDDDLDKSFATFAREQIGALMIAADPFFDTRRDRIITLVAGHGWPAIYQFRDYVLAGGLMSYGASITDTYRQNGIYVGRILQGAKPADLPVQLPTKFELVLNLTTAKVLGLSVPLTLQASADEVIE